MLRMAIGVLLMLHGLVYLLYVGQSARLFELQPDLRWPDDPLMLSRVIGNDSVRILASFAFSVTAIGFVAGGVGVLLSVSWWEPVVLAAAALGIVSALAFWDGHLQRLGDKGGLGLFINAAILVSLLVLEWPQLAS